MHSEDIQGTMYVHNRLHLIGLARGSSWTGVLVDWFKSQNVPCVPSRLGPFLLSNGTGNRGVDPKYRVAHLSGGCGKFAGESKSARRWDAKGPATEDGMKTKDNGRKWMWRFLGVLVALQLYFVRELLAAFALFALAFAAIAFVIVSLYMLQKSWELAVARVADSNHPVVNFARRGVSAVEDMARRPLRRPGSATPRAI
jgi:hypothetical protein